MNNSKNKKDLAIESLLQSKMAKVKKEVIQVLEYLTMDYDPENNGLDEIQFIKDRWAELEEKHKDECFSQEALFYSSVIFEGLSIGQIRYITAHLKGASKAQLEVVDKENKKLLKAKNSMSEKLDFSKRNDKNVEFTFKIKTPRGESDYISPPIKYHADFEDLYKDFQVNPGQNEQFKITMEIEIKSTRRTGKNYFDLLRHFFSRPPLRMTPVPDMVREVRNNQKEIKRDMAEIKKTGQDTHQTLSEVTGKRYEGIKAQAKALDIGETKMKNIRRQNPELKNENGATIFQLREAESKYKPEQRSSRKAKK